MENETEQIFEEQLKKLPKQVVDFLTSAEWSIDAEKIASNHNLSREESAAFEGEITLVLLGLTHPDEFTGILKKHLGLESSVAETLAKEVDEKIFATIRPALVEFFGELEEVPAEEPVATEEVATVALPVAPKAPQRTWEKELDIAPDNLPTNEEPESFLPPIPPKNTTRTENETPNWDITPAHPFEEKMKKVFTAGQQSMGELSLGPITPQAPASQNDKPAAPLHTDLYREPIE